MADGEDALSVDGKTCRLLDDERRAVVFVFSMCMCINPLLLELRLSISSSKAAKAWMNSFCIYRVDFNSYCGVKNAIHPFKHFFPF